MLITTLISSNPNLPTEIYSVSTTLYLFNPRYQTTIYYYTFIEAYFASIILAL